MEHNAIFHFWVAAHLIYQRRRNKSPKILLYFWNHIINRNFLFENKIGYQIVYLVCVYLVTVNETHMFGTHNGQKDRMLSYIKCSFIYNEKNVKSIIHTRFAYALPCRKNPFLNRFRWIFFERMLDACQFFRSFKLIDFHLPLFQHFHCSILKGQNLRSSRSKIFEIFETAR